MPTSLPSSYHHLLVLLTPPTVSTLHRLIWSDRGRTTASIRGDKTIGLDFCSEESAVESNVPNNFSKNNVRSKAHNQDNFEVGELLVRSFDVHKNSNIFFSSK